MIPGQPELDISQFDEAFFASYEQQMADVSLEEQAQAALADILTVKTEDGQAKSFETIRSEAEVFFSNPLIARDMQLLEQLASQYAHFCQGHGIEASQIFTAGAPDDLTNNHNSRAEHSHELDEDDEETDKKAKKKSTRHLSLWQIMQNIKRK